MSKDTSSKKVYIFAGGGSGGHLCPGIAVAEALQAIDPAGEVLFLCTQRQIDEDILKGSGFRYQSLPVVPLPRGIKEVWSFWTGWRASLAHCRDIMQEERPVAVLGLGGFASGPGMKVAAGMGIPVGMLNPDAVPGKANRYGRKFANRIFLQWQESLAFFGIDENKCEVTGCPVRRRFIEYRSKEQAKKELNLDVRRKTLVVMGGSQGGHNVNMAAAACLCEKISDELTGWQIVHITGVSDKEQVQKRYKESGLSAVVLEFTHKMNLLMNAAELVISRAGASSLAELTAVGVGSILLPYPYHKDRHQQRNAKILEKAGAAVIVTDDCHTGSTADGLTEVLKKCLYEVKSGQMAQAALDLGKPDAAERVAHEIRKMGGA
ncbi:MAG: UDP-N-acetylglucosamine--N-acetylmuramyl-(pentapeptide) pyrophosphoryl-undecaprenol N-acetylglucosamine transferase [Sedimentisphaerales bacterium]|nr:UDP-N-acetylglucosamine--N-acetylmuramyl-(pentapeptide) pyrophosphoryl-undecaprenol N-acetylglucosamine transferase [Sedimentisphaerales bacterium]